MLLCFVGVVFISFVLLALGSALSDAPTTFLLRSLLYGIAPFSCLLSLALFDTAYIYYTYLLQYVCMVCKKKDSRLSCRETIFIIFSFSERNKTLSANNKLHKEKSGALYVACPDLLVAVAANNCCFLLLAAAAAVVTAAVAAVDRRIWKTAHVLFIDWCGQLFLDWSASSAPLFFSCAYYCIVGHDAPFMHACEPDALYTYIKHVHIV